MTERDDEIAMSGAEKIGAVGIAFAMVGLAWGLAYVIYLVVRNF